MIRVHFRSYPTGEQRLRVTGHSYWSEAGTDIVCAAVSVLVENLGHSLQLLLGAEPVIEKSSGLYDLHVAPKGRGEQVDLLVAATLLGLRSIAEQYPQRVELDGEVEDGT